MATVATIQADLKLDASKFIAGIKKAEKALDAFHSKSMKMASGMASIGSGMSNMGRGINSAVANIGSGMQQAGGAITRGVTLPLLAAGAGVVALGVNALQVGADFEKAMSGVTAILGGDKAQGKQLSDAAIGLGMDPKLIVSASQAAGVMEELAKNGLSVDQILNGAARGAIALANATGTDFANAAQIASTSLTLFNIPAEKMEGVVNQVTAVANNSRFTVEDFALAIGMGGAAAKASSVPFEEFTAVIAALSTATSSGSDAGTSFKTFLGRLSPITDKAVGAMKDLGIITEDGSNQFFDAAGNMKSMAEVSGVLQKAFSGLNEMDKSNALEVIFGSDAARAAIGLMETGEMGFNNLMAAMAKTDAAANAATRMDNLAGAMEILTGIVEGLKIKFTQTFGPAMRKIVEKISTFLTKNAGRIGGLFMRLGELFGKFGDWLGKAFSDKNALKLFKFFNDIIDAIPEVARNIKRFWDETLKPFIDKLFGSFKSEGGGMAGIMTFVLGLAALGPALSLIGGAIPLIVPALLAIASGIELHGPAIVDFFTRLADQLPIFLAKIQEIGAELGPKLQPLFDAFLSMPPETLATIVTILGALALLGPPLLILGSVISGLSAAYGILSGILIPFATFIVSTAIPAILAFIVANALWLVPLLALIAVVYILYIAFRDNWFGITDIVGNASVAIQGFINNILAKLDEMFNKFTSWTPPDWLSGGAAIMASGTPMGNFINGINSTANAWRHRDSGGSGVAGTPYMIGKGAQPEMFIPSSSGTFVPNAGGQGAGQTTIINITNPKKETAENSIRRALKAISFTGVAQ